MNKFKKYFLLLPLVAITSCGYSVNNLVPGNKYNSPVFQENYYRHWDAELRNAAKEETKDVTASSITRFSDLEKIDPNFALPGMPTNADDYGLEYKMTSVDESFKYGYQSKLFDGRVVCGGYYQLSRVQTDTNGFSIRFTKESNKLQYFAMQFKATTDNSKPCYKVNNSEHRATTYDELNDLDHTSTINLKITLYTKSSKGIIGHPYVSTIVFNGTTNDGSSYKFYAFDLSNEKLTRLVGVSVAYDYDDELINWNKYMDDTHESEPDYKKVGNIDYALFLYEMFFPYTSWN